MEEQENENSSASFIKSNFIVLALLSAGIIFIGVGVFQMLGQNQASIKFEDGSEVLGSNSSSTTEIKVDVDGAVEKPGLYTLNPDARVQDALVAAGGLASNANRTAINLAQKLADGQKLYVPAVGETVSTINLISNSSEGSSTAVSINNAAQSELEGLPGIGPVTATKIIDGRPYGSIEELLDKKSVGNATFEKIKDLITL
jgi:competence protein ComEA